MDGVPHSRKDLQLVRGGVVIPSKKPTAALIKADKIGKAAYNPVVKDLMGSRPTLEQVETIINEPRKVRGNRTERDYVKFSGRTVRKPATKK